MSSFWERIQEECLRIFFIFIGEALQMKVSILFQSMARITFLILSESIVDIISE